VTASTSTAPVVVTAGSTDPDAPLVVLLHGRGADESSILSLADLLAPGPAFAAVRAPIAEGGGFAWFANRGIGRPVAESLRETMDWFRGWLDRVAPAGRPVVLIGFSGGAALVGGLLLDDPSRYAGGAILYGTLPFDAGVPTATGRLVGVPVFVAQGAQDTVIPRELLDRTWTYLHDESGAPTSGRRDPVGHALSAGAVGELATWLQHRLAFLANRPPSAPPGPAAWSTLPGGVLPERRGPRPAISHHIPQQQTSGNAPVALQDRLFAHVTGLAGVTAGPSAISVAGARGFVLAPPRRGPADAFLVPAVREFAHLHPRYDGSLHLALPSSLAADAIRQGWAVPHPWAGVRLSPGFVLVYGPRDDDEFGVVAAIVETSHAWAAGLGSGTGVPSPATVLDEPRDG
jgi:phospholipase/carboxylesterase